MNIASLGLSGLAIPVSLVMPPLGLLFGLGGLAACAGEIVANQKMFHFALYLQIDSAEYEVRISYGQDGLN